VTNHDVKQGFPAQCTSNKSANPLEHQEEKTYGTNPDRCDPNMLKSNLESKELLYCRGM